jgi:S-adenosylmethionine hydrolase
MLVTLTSDFGLENEGPGVMAATVLSVCPSASVVHLSHGVTPFNIMEGARQMECAITIPMAIHVCVIDPGVGSDRKGVVLRLGTVGYLVGPDNGVLLPAAKRAGGEIEVREIRNDKFLRQPVSSTFQGRDMFASIAGHLACGISFHEVGPLLTLQDLQPAPYTDAEFLNGRLRAMVTHINRFGNCMLNILEEELRSDSEVEAGYELLISSSFVKKIVYASTFSSVELGAALLYPDSYGRIAIALNQGNAAEAFGLKIGSEIELVR